MRESRRERSSAASVLPALIFWVMAAAATVGCHRVWSYEQHPESTRAGVASDAAGLGVSGSTCWESVHVTLEGNAVEAASSLFVYAELRNVGTAPLTLRRPDVQAVDDRQRAVRLGARVFLDEDGDVLSPPDIGLPPDGRVTLMLTFIPPEPSDPPRELRLLISGSTAEGEDEQCLLELVRS